MYQTDQSRFLNSAIEIRTALDPMELLRLLKRVEKEVGREKTFENGPRVVDVDLIYYGEESRKDGKKGDPEVDGVGWLQVPHWGRCEREFVLRPLCE
jgi:dihydroneopterin aldolase/2-amino-4-hydroxy-6-hydroxymethyldihydropteridine diphosphokinase/dihydropteroate synthase